MNRTNRFLMLSGILAIFGAVSCRQGSEKVEQAVQYPLLKLTPVDRELSVGYTSVIKGRQDVDIRPQVSGFISEVRVKEGAKVRKGEVLFVIDTIPYAAAYAQAKAAVTAAEAGVATSGLSLESSKELYAEKVISDFELQTSQNAYNSAVASLELARAQALNAENNYSYTKVTSPVDGYAGMTSIRVGTLVSAASAQPLISVSDNSKMYVYFSLSEKEVLKMTDMYGSIENTVKSFAPVTLTLSDGSVYEREGHIDVISGIVNPTTGTVSLRAVFDNPEGRLMSGGSGSVNIRYVHKNSIVIPQAATYEVQDKVYTYKVVDGKAVSTRIKVFGINDGKEYVVEEGLVEGDVIVASGAGLLKEGTAVTGTPKETSVNKEE